MVSKGIGLAILILHLAIGQAGSPVREQAKTDLNAYYATQPITIDAPTTWQNFGPAPADATLAEALGLITIKSDGIAMGRSQAVLTSDGNAVVSKVAKLGRLVFAPLLVKVFKITGIPKEADATQRTIEFQYIYVPVDPDVAASLRNNQVFEGTIQQREYDDGWRTTAGPDIRGPGPSVMCLSRADPISVVEDKAIKGDVMAQMELGRRYLDGYAGAKQDLKKAAEWFTKAAEAGSPGAQDALAEMLYTGRGVARDDEKAIFWFQKSLEQRERDQREKGTQFAISTAYDLAFIFATDAEHLKPKEALSLAEKSFRLDKNPFFTTFDVLAAVYARNGRFTEAAAAEEEAIRRVQVFNEPDTEKQATLQRYKERLAGYSQGIPLTVKPEGRNFRDQR